MRHQDTDEHSREGVVALQWVCSLNHQKIKHRRSNVRGWLQILKIIMSDNLRKPGGMCVIK